MLQVALLSWAHVHAGDYARQVAADPRTTLTVVWDADARRGAEAARTLGVPFEPDLHVVLARPDVDAVVVTTPSVDHPQVITLAAQAGKHVFTEKVLALTTAECDQILEAVRASGVQLMISLPQLSRSDVRYADDVLAAGLLGEITLVRARVGHDAALAGWWPPGNWFRDPRLAGGGALIDLGCHPVYLARHFGGPVRRVTARLSNFSGAYEVDDNAVVLLEFAEGALGVVEASWVQGPGGQPLEIYGTRGTLVIDRANGSVQAAGDAFTPGRRGWFQPASLPPAGRMPLTQWVDAILDGTAPDILPQHGRDLTEIMEAATRSHATGAGISLPMA
jgi:predicted dehydrogenase